MDERGVREGGLEDSGEDWAAQKLNLSSSPHRRRRSGDENIGPDELPIFPNGYAALLLKSPPPAPPALLRRIGVKELTGVGKALERGEARVFADSPWGPPDHVVHVVPTG
ncbi:hypothetical protein DMN91_004528 [Ooceraea biroi]|uniref:Uncharacterized protein n=1 Tax=Ooceraea biroi TaxID=2015173 RepID=A0A3L8DP77_OOCBI|nr:hypothetical protein DMN91_004528 [Ooceraea biroi]